MKKIAFMLAIVMLLSCLVSCDKPIVENSTPQTVPTVEDSTPQTVNIQITGIDGDTVTAGIISSSGEKPTDYVIFTRYESIPLFVNDKLCITYAGTDSAGRLNITDIDVIASGDPGDTYNVEDNQENRSAGEDFTCVTIKVERFFDSFFVGYNYDENDGITYVIDYNREASGYVLSDAIVLEVEAALPGMEKLYDVVLSGAIYDASKKIVRATGEKIHDYFKATVVYKPVIYLYPTSTAEVCVRLTGPKLTCTYPSYNDGWKVTAQPDGTLTDESGKIYSYLYWEGQTDAAWDFSRGFCIEGCKTAEFLEEALEKLGLTRREANEFIVYWLPLMQDNKYNVISFQTDVYTEAAKLEISPAPDTLIRVFMTWYASDEAVEIPAQELTAPSRDGFVAVEWGGSNVK